MMLKFVVGFLLFNSYQIIESRKCSGINGIVCCTGYSWNETAGICEKCPKGYLGDCSQRCISPAYGEDCQSLCNCADGYYCHFANGCTLLNENKTKYQTPSSTEASVSNPTSEKHVTIFTQDFYKRVSQTRENPSHDLNENMFKMNSVNIVIIVLIGMFVLCFALFVFTYIYFKCFRKKSNSREIKENELQARYKSLDFEAMISEQTGHQAIEPRRRFVSDSSYLSPIFVHSTSHVEPLRVIENETRSENNQVSSDFELHRQALTNEVNLPPGDLTDHVYIEITDDDHNLDTTNLTAESGHENKEDMDITRSDN